MRTTVEISDKQRAELLRLAAERGLKGFSPLIHEALDDYLQKRLEQRKLVKAALRLEGTMNAKESLELEKAAKKTRDSWR